MLSVLVMFVGVVEILDCWNNIHFHLIDPRHKRTKLENSHPLPSKDSVVSVEKRHFSQVDICWPKDLSPSVDLHVIKKRSRLDKQRSFELDDSPSRQRTKAVNYDDTSEDGCHSPPEIVVQCPDINDPVNEEDIGTDPSESNPQFLELNVIFESDSSSELDEPTQIENPEYIKAKITEAASLPLKESETVTFVASINDEDQPLERQVLEGALIPHILNLTNSQISSTKGTSRDTFGSQTFITYDDQTKLPIFTNCILSDNAMNVPCSYATETAVLNGGSSGKPATDYLIISGVDSSDIESTDPMLTKGDDEVSEHPVSWPSDEFGATAFIKQTTELPTIALVESSPVHLSDDSDSTLNTSDASWLINSRTSERLLKVRFSPSPEEIAKAFLSVTKVDLKSFGPAYRKSTEHDLQCNDYEGAPLELKMEAARFVDVLIDTAVQIVVKGPFNMSDLLHECNGHDCRLANTEKYNETNSSSSSLSGIPQLPEDFNNSNTTDLPANNCSYDLDDLTRFNLNPPTGSAVRTNMEESTATIGDTSKHQDDESKNVYRENMPLDISPVAHTTNPSSILNFGEGNSKNNNSGSGCNEICSLDSAVEGSVSSPRTEVYRDSEDNVSSCVARKSVTRQRRVANNECVSSTPPASIETATPEVQPSTSRETNIPEVKPPG